MQPTTWFTWVLLSSFRHPGLSRGGQPVRRLIDERYCHEPPAASEQQEDILTDECLSAATNRWRPFGIAIIGTLKASVPWVLIGLIYDTGIPPGRSHGETGVAIRSLY